MYFRQIQSIQSDTKIVNTYRDNAPRFVDGEVTTICNSITYIVLPAYTVVSINKQVTRCLAIILDDYICMRTACFHVLRFIHMLGM